MPEPYSTSFCCSLAARPAPSFARAPDIMKRMSKHIVVREISRPEPAAVNALGKHGVATVHEAQGRTGLLAPYMRPIYSGTSLAGPAVTVLVPAGDNWM